MDTLMVERHYDEEALIPFLDATRAAADLHLVACAECRQKLASFRLLADTLREEDVWDTRILSHPPVPETIKNLRAFADRMAAEDTAAGATLAEFLAGERETWMPRLQERPEWRTAGMVRQLLVAYECALDTMPSDAVAITALAVDIAEQLPVASHPGDTVAKLRGAAWRDRAYALFYTGQFADAEKALCVSESHFSDCVVGEYDAARVGIVKSVVLRAYERLDDATAAAKSSADTFAIYEDETRATSAGLAAAQLLFSRNQYKEAFSQLSELRRRLEQSGDTRNYARVLGNLGYCCWHLRRVNEALQFHETAAAILDAVDSRSESARERWNIALILASEGRLDEALARFVGLLDEFQTLGMTNAWALINLEIAELRLARGEYDTVEAICQSAMRTFEAAGLSHTRRALRALAFMKEAAQNRTATPRLVQHVREYIRRIPQEEQLLFAPPPLE
jgi:tetratricopeptide (TPR) repeat protein